MSKKYYWIIDGKYYEVSKETYQKFKREYDHEKMLSAREELPSGDKLLLELLFDKNMSQDEAAKIIGMSQSTISYRLEKVLDKIRRKMGVKK